MLREAGRRNKGTRGEKSVGQKTRSKTRDKVTRSHGMSGSPLSRGASLALVVQREAESGSMGKKRLGRLGTASERGRGEATTSLAVLCCVLAGLGSIHRMFALHEPDVESDSTTGRRHAWTPVPW